MPTAPQAKLTVVAEFPEHFFLENMAVRADGSMLITVQNRKELWFVPAPGDSLPVEPLFLHTFEFNTTFVVEWEPERFLLGVADVYDTREAKLYEIGLGGWSPGLPISPRLVLEFPEPWAGLNGACFIAPNVLLAAGVAGLIWRVDLGDTSRASARIWLQHDSMKNRPGEKKPEQPGTNGVQFDARTNYLYYTTTSQQMMLRVKVNPATQDPADLPEFVAGGRQWDDFLIDEEAGVAYVTTHRENTIDRVRLAHDGNRERTVIAGDPFTKTLVGPSAGAWSRAERERSHRLHLDRWWHRRAAQRRLPQGQGAARRAAAGRLTPVDREERGTMAERPRHLETVSADGAKIVTCTDGEGPTLVVLPSYGRDSLHDFDCFTDQIVAAGWRVLRPQPRGIAGSAGPMISAEEPIAGIAGASGCRHPARLSRCASASWVWPAWRAKLTVPQSDCFGRLKSITRQAD